MTIALPTPSTTADAVTRAVRIRAGRLARRRARDAGIADLGGDETGSHREVHGEEMRVVREMERSTVSG